MSVNVINKGCVFHERVVVCLREKKGLVRDVAFSTTRPDEVMGLLT